MDCGVGAPLSPAMLSSSSSSSLEVTLDRGPYLFNSHLLFVKKENERWGEGHAVCVRALRNNSPLMSAHKSPRHAQEHVPLSKSGFDCIKAA